MLMKWWSAHEAIHDLFIYVCVGRLGGWRRLNGHFCCGTKAPSYLFCTRTDAPYLQHLMNFAVDTEFFSAIVPIFFWLLLKCQDVVTNAHWPMISQIRVSSFSFLLILLSRNNKCIFFQTSSPIKFLALAPGAPRPPLGGCRCFCGASS